MDFMIYECRRIKEKKEVAEPEADPERDQRTVFAYQVCYFLFLLILTFFFVSFVHLASDCVCSVTGC